MVEGSAEISASGKANKFYQCTPFRLSLDLERVAELAKTIPEDAVQKKERAPEP